jgi:hypothetical protein
MLLKKSPPGVAAPQSKISTSQIGTDCFNNIGHFETLVGTA